jgi:S-adenosylmethionine:tRNA ribosyltransferase-isomerase
MIKPDEFLKNIHISDFDYPLPEARIAKYPLKDRDASKLLIYRDEEVSQTVFSNLPDLLTPDDLLVFNNTRVIPARLKFKKPTGAAIEIFCLEPVFPSEYEEAFRSHKPVWKCIVGNLKKWKDDILYNEIFYNGHAINLYANKIADFKTYQHIAFSWDDTSLTFAEIIELAGVTPIPPYLNRESEDIDQYRYQTVYSKIKGSVAAPTAGLHFTEQLFQKISSKESTIAEVTLHVGAGTFKPIQTGSITEHEMHTEYFSVSLKTLMLIIKKYGNIISVGTTTLRTLESLYWLGIKIHNKLIRSNNPLHINQWDAYTLEASLSFTESIEVLSDYLIKNNLAELIATTQIMIVPGYKIRSIKALITNFHQPKSTLLLLVAGIVGTDWKKVYNYAMENDFRFLSYGDSSILYLTPCPSPEVEGSKRCSSSNWH